jgi:hypothetical protein
VLNGVVASNAGSYDIVVTNLYGSVTSAVAVLTEIYLPAIVTQPGSQTKLIGSTASFSVTVSGPGPFSYQWQFNGTNLPNGVITTVAGNGTNGYSGDGGAAVSAELYYPVSAAVDVLGNQFITDYSNQRIRKVGTNGIITTVAGNGADGYSGDGGAATSAELNYPVGLSVDASGNLFVADQSNQRIRKVGTNGIITTVAGNGAAGYSGDGDAATSAELNYPYDVAVDASGNLFIADAYNQRIRNVTTNGIITTVAGNGAAGYSGDGSAAASAELNSPAAVALDAFGNLFIVDYGNQRIRKVGTNATIATVAGDGTAGYSGDGGSATSAELNFPFGAAMDASGNLFIADQNNNRLRKVFLQGPTIVFYAVGSSNAGSYDVVVSNLYGSVTSSLATLTVVTQAAPQITLQPTNQSVLPGGNASFSADAVGLPPLAYQWQFDGTNLTAATNTNLALNSVVSSGAGSYDVVIANAYGVVTSATATLSVLGVPVSFVTNAGGMQFSNGQFYLSLSGLTGQGPVLIETSTNLTQWTPIFTNPPGFGTIQFVDPNASNSAFRYYRASTPGP